MDRAQPLHQRLAKLINQEKGAITELWKIYTQDRAELRRQLLAGKREAVAYLLGFHLPNAARMTLLLDRLHERVDVKALFGGEVVAHDLGCGAGAMSQAFLHKLRDWGMPREKLSLNLSDASNALLDTARAGLEELGEDAPEFATRRLAIEALQPDRFAAAGKTSVYLLGYVLNELEKNPRAKSRLGAIFAGHLERKERAVVLIVEPATQEMSRGAMMLRDELVQAGYVPLYPCPHASNCPMLERTRDWCYAEGVWKGPQDNAIVDKIIGIDRRKLAATLFAFATPGTVGAPRWPDAVVVGRPERADGDGFEYLLCQKNGELGKMPGNTDEPAKRGTTAEAAKAAAARAPARPAPRDGRPAKPGQRDMRPARPAQRDARPEEPGRRKPRGAKPGPRKGTPAKRR